MPKIHPFLWFDKEAEEAANFYVSIFKKAKIHDVNRMNESDPPLVVTFELEGQHYVALNGGPGHPFTDAISLQINCTDQSEVDYYYDRLVAGGKEIACGWLTDKFGVTWQVTPTRLGELLLSSDRTKANRAMEAMMKMKKIDIAAMEAAYEQC